MNENQNNLGTTFKGKNSIAENCKILNSYIENCVIEDNVKIYNSILKNCKICKNSKIGPFSHIRDYVVIGENCSIGNFVEIKNSYIGKQTRISHHVYCGDVDIGTDCNISCGVIFCNYDGHKKHRAKIGNRVFIGSNVNIIAPVKIEDNVYIACGTTVTKNLSKGEMCIGRSRQEPLNTENKYQKNFEINKKYFGTDGIRGIWNSNLTADIIKKVAKSVCYNYAPKIVIGLDTRASSKEIASIFISTAKKYGAKIYNIGIATTPCIAYYTKQLGANFGIVITASHNPEQYNGIKVLNEEGIKLNDNEESDLEKLFEKKIPQRKNKASVNVKDNLEKYINFVQNLDTNKFDKIKVVLDCANGSASKTAPQIFENLYANVKAINTNGVINQNCGALYPSVIINEVIKNNADLGFAFDGDADRIIAVNSRGQLLDGDEILYILAWYYKKQNALTKPKIVGTVYTNIGIENKLKALGLELIRTPVGDKYIIEEMEANCYLLGGEQSGHIINKQFLSSGDGVLTARILTSIFLENKHIFDSVKENKWIQVYKNITLPKQYNYNILNNKEIISVINFYKTKLANNGRIVVRQSGTELTLRILVETSDRNLSNIFATEIKRKLIEKIKYL